MRRDVVLLAIIALAALGIRTYPSWNAVFTNTHVSFLETDAWYHVRLVENQIRNFPWRVTRDPFASASAQFVPIAPLYDTLTSAAVIAVHGRDATTRQVEGVAAWLPPVFGALTVVIVWALGRQLFDRRAALIAAALLAVLPGHFMDRTMLGFVDHHALEALLAMAVLWAVVRGVEAFSMSIALVAGLALGAYLLTWGSGAFLVAVLGAWLMCVVLLSRHPAEQERAAWATAIAGVIALVAVRLFQDPAMHRYGTQVFAVAGLTVLSGTVAAVLRAPFVTSRRAGLAVLAVAGIAVTLLAVAVARETVSQLLVDLARFTPDPSRMGVLEARPMFLYGGNWDWMQPWRFFRTGVLIGAVALVPFAVRVWRQRRAGDLLLFLYAVVSLVATIGQNRFGYYLVPACALLGGWLAVQLLDWAGVPHAHDTRPTPRTRLPLARELAVVGVVGGMFAPNLPPSVLLAERSASFPVYWRQTMEWLRAHTSSPFGARTSDDYYYADYDTVGLLTPEYTVMSWWDQGYWITQQARRVPVANPTQEHAGTAAQFYTATDEAEAVSIAHAQGARYVIADFELPFRRIADGSIMGRFQTIVDWTGKQHDDFYEVAYRRDGGRWVPVWLFYEPYYRSMAFRLSARGGEGVTPADSTVVALATRVDGNGLRFREVLAQQTFATYEQARRAKDDLGADAVIAGLDPWQSAFPIEPLQSFVQLHEVRTPEQQPGQASWVRIFELR